MVSPQLEKLRCDLCKKTQDDWDKEGRFWAIKNSSGGYGVPGIKRLDDGRVLCFFCVPELEPIYFDQQYQPQLTYKPIAIAIRWMIFERDNFTCRVCGKRRFLTIDHIKPRIYGGTDVSTNLQTLCRWCNSKKGIR